MRPIASEWGARSKRRRPARGVLALASVASAARGAARLAPAVAAPPGARMVRRRAASSHLDIDDAGVQVFVPADLGKGGRTGGLPLADADSP